MLRPGLSSRRASVVSARAHDAGANPATPRPPLSSEGTARWNGAPGAGNGMRAPPNEAERQHGKIKHAVRHAHLDEKREVATDLVSRR